MGLDGTNLKEKRRRVNDVGGIEDSAAMGRIRHGRIMTKGAGRMHHFLWFWLAIAVSA